MKTKFILGMLATVMTVSTAFGAGGKAMVTRETMEAKITEKIRESESGRTMIDVRDKNVHISNRLVERFASKNETAVPVVELRAAMDAKIGGTTGKEVALKLLGIQDGIKMIDEQVRRNEIKLDDNAQAKMKAQLEIYDSLISLLADMSKMSLGRADGKKSMKDIKAHNDAATKLLLEATKAMENGSAQEIGGFQKVLSKMDAIKASRGQNMTLDQLFEQAMRELYGDQAEAKIKELLDCV